MALLLRLAQLGMSGSRGLRDKELIFDFGDNINKASDYGCRGDKGNNHSLRLV